MLLAGWFLAHTRYLQRRFVNQCWIKRVGEGSRDVGGVTTTKSRFEAVAVMPFVFFGVFFLLWFCVMGFVCERFELDYSLWYFFVRAVSRLFEIFIVLRISRIDDLYESHKRKRNIRTSSYPTYERVVMTSHSVEYMEKIASKMDMLNKSLITLVMLLRIFSSLFNHKFCVFMLLCFHLSRKKYSPFFYSPLALLIFDLLVW